MTDWFTAPEGDETAQERLVDAWPEAPLERLEMCQLLLGVAREQVIAYAPAERDGDDWTAAPPDRFVLAQIKQAENLWNAGRVASDGNVGDGGFVFTPRPLDKTIRQIIRPQDGKPHVL